MVPRRPRGRDGRFLRQVHGSGEVAALEELQPDVRVDAVGTFCPEPVIRTQKRMSSMDPGEVLLLLADDAGVEVDIPAWCLSTGNEYLGIVKEPDRLLVYVRKAGAASGRE